MFVEYEVLDKETGENVSEEFSREMKKKYEGEDGGGTCKNNVNVRFYRINANNDNVIVSYGFLYPKRNTSVIINGDNENQISEITSKIEKETEFALIEVEHGN